MNGQPFYALIIPQDALPTPPGGGQPGYPTHPWVPPYGPSHPIAPGGPPPGYWGGRPPEYVDIGGPRPQPPQGGRPSHPIYFPPRIWGGGGVGDYIDAGGPGPQPGGPVYPSHPIYYPPRYWGGRPPEYVDIGGPGPQPYPDQGLPGSQPYPDQSLPWPQPHPSHPIVIPPEDLPSEPVGPDKMVIVVWVPGTGYKMVVVPKPPGYNPPTGPSTERPTPVQATSETK